MQTHIIVIGDRFAGFSRPDSVLTVGQARQFLEHHQHARPDDHTHLHLGQAVSGYDRCLLESDLERLGLQRVSIRHQTERLAGRRHVHKNREANVLIANLADDNGSYRADLRIHNDNELLLDHQTGLHVQGVLITEAARQMFLAVSETWLAPSRSQYEYYYVIEKMTTEYENFLFPLPASMRFTTKELHNADPNRVSVACSIELFQATRRCAVTDVAFTAFAPTVIGHKEARRAEQALASVLDEAQNVAVPA